MKTDQARRLLGQALAELAQARGHLEYSFQRVSALPEDLNNATAANHCREQKPALDTICERVAAYAGRICAVQD